MTSLKNIFKPFFLVLFCPGILSFPALAQIHAYYDSGIFNTPQNQPFIETYLTIVGKSLSIKEVDHHLQNSVGVEMIIRRDSNIVKTKKYNLIGPPFTSSLSVPSFIDNQRYSLPNGSYDLQMTLTDHYDPTKKPLVIKQTLDVNFDATSLQSSLIQALESFKKTEVPTNISKCGYDLIPYSAEYYPESTKDLTFYFEVYNADVALGAKKPFIFTYYIETSDQLSRLSNFGGFKKQEAAKVNPLLAKLALGTLGTGNYNLVVEVRDGSNKVMLTRKMFFQRLNRAVDIVTLQGVSERQLEAEYFGNCNNADTLKMYVECLWPIADGLDKERIINQAVKKDPDLMKRFAIDFWQRRAADTANPLKMWARYYQSVQKVMVLFKCGKQKGYYTERGRVYLQYGPPDQRAQQANEPNTYPYEIWHYYHGVNAANGIPFTNRRFVFVNRNLGDDCYSLIHSDLSGEINNPRWQFELTRRNNDGIGNPDQLTPRTGTEFNQFNEIYSNPR